MKLPKAYDPGQYEADIYALWEQQAAFKPINRGDEGYYSLTLPPPNANGDLHMGHALTVAIEDSLVRYHRMKGRAALYIPGADHAGFETWVVFEKKLNSEGSSRFDYKREELYRMVWDFVEANKHNFQAQLRALGGSLDWSKFTYTLDKKVVATAYETFRKMWDEGLIYRGKRIVNFCTFHGTSFSDIEVVHEEENSKLWHIAYPLAGGEGEIIVATTRPETMLGDTAVAVHPDDKRYKALVGQAVKLPLVEREIPIVADEMVDPQFGSGAVKVTPGHDPNDFELAQRHDLPVIELITPEGRISQEAPERFRGKTVAEARQAVESELERVGYLRKVEDYRHTVGKCYKCGTVIEPLLREQWFVKMRPLADRAIKELAKDKIRFYPASKKQQTINYLTEVRDWNISRQIPWGIPIPAFQNIADPKDWVFDARVDQETIEVGPWTYKRDPDVFDTWFSSGHWPQVTLNYPDGEDFKKFHPLSLMETGGEILYQWVARMIMLGLYVTDDVPFTTVYIHGYVLAEDGAKMSKSLGNVINPVEAVAEYGSDALRAGLLTGRRPGINQGYHLPKIQAARNFANKLWNVSRFIEDKAGGQAKSRGQAAPQTLADHWVLDRLNETANEVGKAMENYRISEAFELVYQFIWHDLADWYVEASKIKPNQALLAYALEASLKLTHPFAPFVTETIWQILSWEGEPVESLSQGSTAQSSLLAVAPWPTEAAVDKTKARQFQDLVEIISEARRITTAVGVKSATLYYRASPLIGENADLISRLGRLGQVTETTAVKGQGIRVTKAGYDVWLDIGVAETRAYIDRLIEQRSRRAESVERLEGRLASPGYAGKAPPEVVDQTRQHLEEEKILLTQDEAEIDTFSKLAGPAKTAAPGGPAPNSPPAENRQTTERASPDDPPPSD
jgi:valyl-tRNA synthetase